MADQTFEQLWKRLLVYAPEMPIPLAQELINNAYSRALSESSWAGLRAETAFIVPDAYTTGTAAVTQSSTSVTGSGTTWTSAMIGRQFYTGGTGPFYTITAVGSATALTLDRVYEKATAATATYAIQQVYLDGPSDLLHLKSVKDLTNNWRLHTGWTQEQLDIIDAQRSTTGTPVLLATAPFGSDGLPRWELWPRTEAAAVYAVLYIKRPALLSAASDRPIFPIRGDILRHGALAEFALWPGTAKSRNPFYDINQHALHEQLFLQELAKVNREDQEIGQTAITFGDWEVPYAPIDAAFIQAHGGPLGV